MQQVIIYVRIASGDVNTKDVLIILFILYCRGPFCSLTGGLTN